MGDRFDSTAQGDRTKANPAFPVTHWSLILTAAQSDSPHARDALARLCSTYWYPLYAFIRRRGHPPHEAEDLTQGFFARLLDGHYLDGVTAEGGRFRSYLLVMLKRFLAKEHRKGQTEKRGGKVTLLSLDAEAAEKRYQFEPAEAETPESLFERRWAATLLQEVMVALRREYELSDRLTLFEALRGNLSGERYQRSHLELGKELGMSEGAVKVAVHRLRRRYGELLRAEIAKTLDSPGDIDAEIRYLISILG